MTPFESYFASKIQAALKGAPESAIDMAKASAAEIWNAALDALGATIPNTEREGVQVEPVVKRFMERAIERVRVTP